MNTDNTKPAFWDNAYIAGRDYMIIEEVFLTELLKKENKVNGSILDVGCGTGDLIVKLSQKGFNVTGLDISPVAIKKATERASQEGIHPSLIVGDIFSLDTSIVYDVIFCKLVYAFIVEKTSFLKEVGKHLAPKGIFILITPILDATNKDIEKKPGICVGNHDIGKLREVFPLTKEYKTEIFPEGRIIKTFISEKE